MLGTIEWYDADGARRGERELGSERADCAAFARTLAFAVAVQIQLLGEEDEEQPSRVETSPPEARASATPKDSKSRELPSPPPSPSAAVRETPWRFIGGMGVTGHFGMFPGLVPTGRLFAGLRRRHFGIELGGEASLPGRYRGSSGSGFDHRAAFGSLAGCGFLGLFSACVVGKVGALRVSGVGVDVPYSPAGASALLGARLSLNPELGRLAGALRLEALAPLLAWGVTLNGQEVFRNWPVVVGLGADVGAFF